MNFCFKHIAILLFAALHAPQWGGNINAAEWRTTMVNARGREVEKHIPGAGWTCIVYNKLDQPVLMQDADQRTRNEWSFTKYDAHGRVVTTGLYASTASRETLQNNVYAAAQWENRGTSAHGYTNSSFPTDASKCEILTVNYYDDYDFDRNNTQDYPLAGADARTHGLPTGSKTRVLDSQPEQWLTTVHFYDSKGRVIRTTSEQIAPNHTKMIDETKFEYDFVGKLLKSERKLKTNN